MTNDYGNLELHKVLLAAMKDIDRICRENGLRYYLYAGTLLGAVNHGGFIPWDDDVDVVMFPEDFKILARELEAQFSDRYQLCTFDNSPGWFSKMNKLYVKGTKVFTQHCADITPIAVDVCVLHNVPDGKWQRLFQRKEIELINLVLHTQAGAVVPTSWKSKLVLGNLAKAKREYLGKRLDKVMSRYDDKVTEYVGIMCNTLTPNPYTGRSGYENDMTKRAAHEQPVYIDFEDMQAVTISHYEEDLVMRYGPNWAEPYPEEKRITKHDVKSYEISDEVRERVGI